MADLNAINLEITGTSESAQEAIKSTVQALEGLKSIASGLSALKISSNNIKGISAISGAMKGIADASASLRQAGSGNFEALNGFASAVNQIATACKSLTQGDITRLQAVANVMTASAGAGLGGARNAAQNVQKVFDRALRSSSRKKPTIDFGKAFGSIGTGIKNIGGSVLGGLVKVGKAFNASSLFAGKFVQSLIRIAKYRFIRSVLSSITGGAEIGLKNLANASAEANATLSQLSGGVASVQNAMGGALYSVLASIVGVLNTIISAAVTAINWVNMLFAILGGRATFKRATNSAKEYGSALGGAAGGAKALKQELMGFDEINALSPDSGGGGGGGGGGGLNYGGMFEETPVDESLAEMVEKADFTLLGEKLATKINTSLAKINWDKIITGAWRLANSLATFINGAVDTLDENVVGDSIAGIVNTALTFVNQFTYTVDWRGLGDKIKQFILRAIRSIDAGDVGLFLAAKLNGIVRFLAGILPSTVEEWSAVTTWVADCLKKSVEAIDEDSLSQVISGIIRGGLSLITSLGESGAFSNLVATVLGAITDALSTITPEELAAAVNAALSELWAIAKQLVTFVIDIAKIELKMDNPVVSAFSTLAVYNILKKALPAFGIKGFTSGKTLALAGAVMATLDVIAGISDIVGSIKNGEGVDGKKVALLVSRAFEAAGFTLITSGNVYAGAIVLGIGVVMDAFLSIKEFRTSESLLPEGAFEIGVRGAINLEEMQTAIDMLSEAGGEISTAVSVLETAQTEAAKIAENSVTATQEINNLLGTAIYGTEDQATMALTTLAALGVVAIDAEGKITPVVDKLTELGIVVKESDFGAVINGTEAIANAANTAGSAAESASTAVSEYNEAVENANATSVSDAFADVDSSSISNTAGAAEDLATAMQATGEQAEILYTKIIEIPSDIVYNLELNNYDQIMTDLDALKTAVSDSGVLGVFGFKTAFSGLSGWVTDNVVNPISNAFKGIDLASAGRKMMRGLKSGMRAIDLPKLKVTWGTSSSTASILGKTYTITIPKPNISFYAKGGFPTVGELFMANEAGPELVGKIGNRSAVANETQIGDAIFKYMDAHDRDNGIDVNALAGAIASALKSAGIGAVYLDGKMLGNSINREAKRSGKPVINF